MSKTKLASDQVAATIAQVGPALRALSEENQGLKEKVAAYERTARVEKIASNMEAKQLDTTTTHAEKVASLLEHDDLDVVEKAIDMSAPQIKLAAVSDHVGNPSDAASAFASGLLDG